VRIFLDSNVWISALTTRGLCSDLVRLLLRRHGRGTIELLLGEPVREETFRILTGRFRATESDLAQVRTAVDLARRVPAPDTDPPIAIDDASDAPIIACALSAQADLFVTGDKALLELGEVGAMSIISPRQMYERLIRRT
jgi:putative PIN family toxin of toxin-antitoxin system